MPDSCKDATSLRTVDLFSGCGGMSLGFKNAGYQLVGAFDNWQPAIDVYSANFDTPIFKRDLSDASIARQVMELAPDVIIGGPPCRDFSQAGNRSEDGDYSAAAAK